MPGPKVEPGIQKIGIGLDSRHPLHWSGAMRE